MRIRPLLLVGLAGAALVTVAALGLAAGSGGRAVHEEGGGPLSTHEGPGPQQVLAMDSASLGITYSFAWPVCLLSGDEATIEDVRPGGTLGTPGTDWSFLGAMVRPIPEGGAERFLAAHGFPPADEYPGSYLPAAGASVSSRCDEPEGRARTDLIAGMRTAPGGAGGGWTGVEIDDRAGGREYTLVVRDTFVVCGSATMSVTECGPVTPSASGSS